MTSKPDANCVRAQKSLAQTACLSAVHSRFGKMSRLLLFVSSRSSFESSVMWCEHHSEVESWPSPASRSWSRPFWSDPRKTSMAVRSKSTLKTFQFTFSVWMLTVGPLYQTTGLWMSEPWSTERLMASQESCTLTPRLSFVTITSIQASSTTSFVMALLTRLKKHHWQAFKRF